MESRNHVHHLIRSRKAMSDAQMWKYLYMNMDDIDSHEAQYILRLVVNRFHNVEVSNPESEHNR